MADSYINATGLQIIKNWITGKFALDSDLDALSDKVDEIISEGGEPNKIDSVSVNGTPVTPDANKNVALTVPTATSDLTNDGDGTSAYATEEYVDENGGKIDVIKVNGTAQTITNKAVDITVPTKVSELTNDGDGTQGSTFATTDEVDTAIAAAVSSVYNYKGSIATYADLPSSGNTKGDVYDVQATGMNYAWTGTAWDALGTYVDTSVLWTSTAGQSNSLIAMTVAEVNAILEA